MSPYSQLIEFCGQAKFQESETVDVYVVKPTV